jgi:hypothetical protein
MLTVIEFLEQMGRDADLRHASESRLVEALTNTQIDPFTRKAIVGADQRRLEFVVGARSEVCCLLYVPVTKEGDEEEERTRKTQNAGVRVALAG